MSTADRLLRADAEEFETDPPPLPKRRQAQRDRIFRLLPRILARRGIESVTLPNLALALDISTAALRRHVIDMGYLLYKILLQHLQFMLDSLLEIPAADPDAAHRRAGACSGALHPDPALFQAARLLWTRDRDKLPEDLLGELEELQLQLAALGGAIGRLAEPALRTGSGAAGPNGVQGGIQGQCPRTSLEPQEAMLPAAPPPAFAAA